MSAAPKLAEKTELSPLPLCIEAEQAVIGTCMVINSTIPQISAAMAQADLYDPFHRRVFEAVLRIDGEGRPVTPLTIRSALGNDPAWDEISWHYLVDMAAVSVGPREAAELARDIAAIALRRRAVIAMRDAQDEIAAPPKRALAEILAPIVGIADKAAESGRGETDPQAGECAFTFLREIEEGKQATFSFRCGLAKLDDELGGFFPQDLIVVGGRPGMGKSMLLTCLARRAAKFGRVDIFSIEMSRRDNVARMLCDIDYDSHTGNALWYKRLTRGGPSVSERERAALASVELAKLDIAIHDSGSVTMAQIAAISRARAARHGKPSMVAIDHLQIVSPSSANGRDTRSTELTRITKDAKALAKTLDCPVFLLSQLNRAVESRGEKERMPTLADLRESGSIEQDADLIIMLYRPAFYLWQKKPRDCGHTDPRFAEWKAKYDPVANSLEVSVPKNRHGPMFDCRLFVDPGAAAIRDEKPAQTTIIGEFM